VEKMNMPITPKALSPLLTASHLRVGSADGVLIDIAALTLVPGVTWVQDLMGTHKTALLRILAGEQTLHGGSLERTPHTQVYWANPQTTVAEPCSASTYFQTIAPQYPAWDTPLLRDFADAVGLTAHWDKPLYMLSTGTRRKVWLCAAVACGAALTLLDEPFAALDARSAATVLEVLTDAAFDTRRAWVVADYVPPRGVHLVQTIELGA